MNYLKNLSEQGKKYEFAGPVLTSPTYAGELALPYVSAALKSGTTLANNWINTLDNVPYKAVINRVEGASLIADATCDFTDAGSVTLTERVLEVKELQVNIDLCKKTMRQGWQAAQTGNSLNSNLPSEFQDHVIGHVAGLVAQATENSIWGGTSTANGEFTGFLTNVVGHFVTDPTVVDEVLAAATSKANVVAQLEQVLDATPSQVLGMSDFAIYTNPKTLYFYQQALGASGYAMDYQANGKPANIYGYDILACEGIPDNNIIATYQSNLNFGSNILTNMTEVRTIDLADIDGSDNVRFVMRYAAGTQHGVGQDIVWATTA